MADAVTSRTEPDEVPALKTGPWSEAEIALLIRLWAENISNFGISQRLGRRENAVAIKASRLNLPPKAVIAAKLAAAKLSRNSKAKMRPCLTCSRQFFSEGPGHRICDNCKSARGWGEDYVVSLGGIR